MYEFLVSWGIGRQRRTYLNLFSVVSVGFTRLYKLDREIVHLIKVIRSVGKLVSVDVKELQIL
jgi:hypothetical protein